MAKELKQRKIKRDNKKYIKLSIVIILIIAVLSLVIVIIAKSIANSKKKVIDNNNVAQINQTNVVETKNNNKNNNINVLDEQLNQLTNNIVNITDATNTTIANTTNEMIEINKNNQKVTKKFELTDAVINGIQREMTIEQVKALLGEPENIQNEQEVAIGYTVQKYFYDGGKTEIDFVALYEPNKFIVHRIKTSSTSNILARELKIGSKAQDVLAAFPSESILYKSQDIIIVGFPGEDPIYATSIKPKLYFTISNNLVTEISLNIGSES